MDHVALIRQMDSRTKAQLTERSDARGLVHLAGHLGALAAMAGYIGAGGPFWGIVILPYGIAMVFLFTLSHECTHATPFARPWLNTVVGHGVAPLIALPFVWFRYFHLAHHKHTNDPDRDPEIAGHGRPETRGAYLVYLSGWYYWSGNAHTLWQNAFGRIDAPYLPPRQHGAMRREARVLLALYAGAVASLAISPLMFWLWVVPALVGQPFLRLYLLAEHGQCPSVADMLANTRTTLTNRLMRALAWNMPYHAEHHAFPNVPFHKLPALHAHTRAHLKAVSPGYAAFNARYAAGLLKAAPRAAADS